MWYTYIVIMRWAENLVCIIVMRLKAHMDMEKTCQCVIKSDLFLKLLPPIKKNKTESIVNKVFNY